MKTKVRYQASPQFIAKAKKAKNSGLAFYKQAMAAGVYPPDYSKILHHGTPLKKDDWRVIAIGQLFGLEPEKQTVRWATTKFKKQYFKSDPDKIITIWLFRTPETYKKGAALLSGYLPDTPYGYYEDEKQQMVMNIATGGGTLVHELFHAYIASNYPDCPTWINEGMGSLYEQCNERAGKIVGMTNWRLAGLKRAIRDKATIGFDKLAAMPARKFYGEGQSVRYAQARYLFYYLQQKNLLGKFFHEAKKQRNIDPTGYNTLVKVLDITDEPAFRNQWEAYCLKLKFPETPTPRPATR